MEADKVLHTFKPNSRFEDALTQLRVPLRGAWINTNGLDGNKLYAIACRIAYWLDSMGHSDAFKTKLKTLIKTYPSVDVTAMGFQAIGILNHYGHNHEETAIHSVKICKLPFRYILAPTQQLGKIHSRCFIWGTLWYKHFKRPDGYSKRGCR